MEPGMPHGLLCTPTSTLRSQLQASRRQTANVSETENRTCQGLVIARSRVTATLIRDGIEGDGDVGFHIHLDANAQALLTANRIDDVWPAELAHHSTANYEAQQGRCGGRFSGAQGCERRSGVTRTLGPEDLVVDDVGHDARLSLAFSPVLARRSRQLHSTILIRPNVSTVL